MIKCKECDRSFDSLNVLRMHRAQKHKINAEQTYIDYQLDGIPPQCKCGCGDKPKFLGINAGFREYKWGHAARVNNNWGHNEVAKKKSHAKQKEMYGDGRLTIWNKGLTVDDERVRDNIDKVMANPERGNNISKALAGVPKSKEHKIKIKSHSIKRWQNQDERDKQANRLTTRLSANGGVKKSKLEVIFNGFLESLGLIENIHYKKQFYVKDIYSFFDFFIYESLTYIEVDGDFWHCNPDGKHPEPIYVTQKKNFMKDKIKNEWCARNNLKLLRFWEKDINNDPEGVIVRIKLELGL